MGAVSKLLKMLKELKLPVIGVVENMEITKTGYVKDDVFKIGLSYLGSIGFDQNLEDAIGDPNKLLKSNFMNNLEKIINKIE
jgi:Mrp family chromosome partitioning ATPase